MLAAMRLNLMIEGQEDVTWPQWLALAQACELHGVGTLFRSDHYLSADGHEERGSLETWATLAGLAAVTSRLRLGVLVSPATFRHPSVLAKNATAVDHISNGRVELGIGAGWNEREHEAYGFEFPALGVRMEMLEEQLAVVRGAWADGAFSLEGRHYRLSALDARPKPVQRPHPPLIIGGAARPRTARLAAQYADEYNTVYATPAECAERRAVCEQAWQDAGRDPATLTFSVMVPWLVGADARDLQRCAERVGARIGSDAVTTLGEFAPVGVTGTLGDALARLRAYRDAGVDRIMLQHLVHDDLDAIALLPRLAAALAG
jgi:F420-dependent oxidoreductase-like protein